MKKILIIIITLFMGISCFAEITTYKSYEFSLGRYSRNGDIRWSEWEDSNVKILANWDKEYVKIYSPETQYFEFLEIYDKEYDSNGFSYQIDCLDADGKLCRLRFRKQNNGELQLYVYYNDIAYVYNIKEIY